MNDRQQPDAAPVATVTPQEQAAPQPPHGGVSMMVAEYTALREEILKRIEFQHNILWISVTATGAFLVLGLEHQISSVALLLYPVLGLILAGAWAHNDVRIHQVSLYLAARYQALASWEARVHSTRLRGRFASLLVQIIFVGTELLAIAAALVLISGIPVESPAVIFPLGGLDVVALIATAVVVGHDRHRSEKTTNDV